MNKDLVEEFAKKAILTPIEPHHRFIRHWIGLVNKSHSAAMSLE